MSRTKLFINLTAGLELLRYVPAPYQAGANPHPHPNPNPNAVPAPYKAGVQP